MTRAIVVLLCLSLPLSARGQQPSNYSVFPITTDLQRLLLRSSGGLDKNGKVVVLIDGPSFIERDGTIFSTALDLTALRNDLKPHRDPQNGTAHFLLYQAMGSKGQQAENLMHYALEGFATRVGFHKGRVSTTYFGERYAWQQRIDEVNRKTGSKADADELLVSNDLVRGAGVRTILSRYLSSNADCVVQVIPTIEESTGEFPPLKIRQAIHDLVIKSVFHDSETILLQFAYRGDGKAAIERFIENRSEKQQYAESLGFIDCRVSMSFSP